MNAAIPYRFRYQLSYLTVFSWTRRLQVIAHDLNLDAAPPTLKLLPGSDGFLLRSMPLPADVEPPTGADDRGRPLLRYTLQRFPRYYIEMHGQTFEAYKAKFSSKTRSTLSRKVRKFADYCGGELRWKRFTRPEELDRFWQLARQVSAKTYQERLLEAGLPHDPAYQAAAAALAANGQLRAYLLFDGDRPVSYLFCPVRDGVVVYAYLGYDPDYRRYSVGTVLQWLALESLFAENRFRFFDFTEGESEHKRLFATGHVECANVVLLTPTLMHRALIYSHRNFNRLAERLGAWLERHGLKSGVRRWLKLRGAGA
jgi:CelD/BcsL family acetyltransferase involved in cellulose biosynthesis